MQFEERLLTDGNADPSHNKSVSFNNCMLRIPGSLNGDYVDFDDRGRITNIPPMSRVRIEKYWDENIPTVSRLLLMQYYNYLQFKAIADKSRYDYVYGRAVGCINLHDYDYVERLFNKPIDNFRKYCIWRVFAPYFINVKRVERVEASDRIKSWLDRCNSVSRLHFNSRWQVDYALKKVGTFYPTRQDRLKDVNKLFYERLRTEGVI